MAPLSNVAITWGYPSLKGGKPQMAGGKKGGLFSPLSLKQAGINLLLAALIFNLLFLFLFLAFF